MPDAGTYREVAESAWAWVLDQVRDDDGPWLPDVVGDDPPRPADDRDSLYAGIAGLAPVLAEIGRYRELAGVEKTLAAGSRRPAGATGGGPRRGDRSTTASPVTRPRCGCLRPGSERVALDRLAELRTPAGWETTLDVRPGSRAPLTDIVMGSAGVVLAAAWVGDATAAEVMTTGGEALLRVAEHDRGRAGLADVARLPVELPELLARHRRGGSGAGRRRARARPGGFRRRRPAGRRAPAVRGLARRRRVRRGAHHPAVAARGGAGDLQLVPRPGRHLATVRRAGPRRRANGSAGSRSASCAGGACTRS